MITVISATNRKESHTSIIAKTYLSLLNKKGIDAKYFSLEQLPVDFAFYEVTKPEVSKIKEILNTFIIPASKLVIVVPEYNGSFPGVLKTFIDIIHRSVFAQKKAALVGISSGRAGNSRGMDQLTNILNYLDVNVLHNKVPASNVLSLLNSHGEVSDPHTIKRLEEQIDEFLLF